MPREIEVKGVTEDLAGCRARLVAAGARVAFDGWLEDRRYDTPDGRLARADEVLRLRTRVGERTRDAVLEWKGPTGLDGGYKTRDEITSPTSDADALATILEHLGFRAVSEVDRTVTMLTLGEATVRLEHYPRMDDLVEVEGSPTGIEAAIAALGMPRSGFTSERLAAFVARFEARTGRRAVLSRRRLAEADQGEGRRG